MCLSVDLFPLFFSLIPTDSNSVPLSAANYCAWMAFSPLDLPPMIRTRMLEVLTNTKQNLIWVHKVIKTEARDDEKLKLSSSVLTAFSCWPSNTRKNHVVDACNDHLSFYMHWCAVCTTSGCLHILFNSRFDLKIISINIPFSRLLTYNITN